MRVGLWFVQSFWAHWVRDERIEDAVQLGVALNGRNVGKLMINNHYQFGPTYPPTNDYASQARISPDFLLVVVFWEELIFLKNNFN